MLYRIDVELDDKTGEVLKLVVNQGTDFSEFSVAYAENCSVIDLIEEHMETLEYKESMIGE